MGRRGPPPKPTMLKLVAGNPGGRPLNMHEPIPPAGEPTPPDWIDDRARAVWAQVVPRLSSIGLARTIDWPMLARYCQLLVMWADATAFIAKNGPTYPQRAPGKDGKPGRVIGSKLWPEQTMIPRLNRELLALEGQFGIGPAARSRIQVHTEKTSKGDVSELKQRFFAPKQA
jgi:P27 family predicted phage terminase small subunit